MSQFYIKSTGGVGPIPPEVPTQFTVDLNSGGGVTGTVTPANNNVNVFGNPTGADQQGLLTQALTTTFPNDTIFNRYIGSKPITLNGATTVAKSIPIPNDTAFTVQALISAYDPATSDVFGGRMLAVGVNNGGTVSILSVIENTSSGTGTLINCHINIDASANFMEVTITGIASQVNWCVLVPTIAIV